MFQYFWLEGNDLPDGIGFGLFTWKHFAADAVCFLGVVLLCIFFCRQNARRQRTILRVTALLLLFGNLARDLFLTIIGHMSVDYLPLHLCSFAIFVYLVHAFLPEHYQPREGSSRDGSVIVVSSPFREALAEIGFVLLMPGTITALIFPDWTRYPLFNFMCIHSFLWHAVLIAYPMMCFLSGRCRPTIRHIWYPVVYLCVIVPPTALFNHLTGCNYLFIMRPLPNTPLEWLYHLMGPYWRIGYALLVFTVILCIYLIIELIRAIARRMTANR